MSPYSCDSDVVDAGADSNSRDAGAFVGQGCMLASSGGAVKESQCWGEPLSLND